MKPHAEAVAGLFKPVLLRSAARFDDVFAEARPRKYGDPHAFDPVRVEMETSEGSAGLALAKLYAGVFGRGVVTAVATGNMVGPFCSVEARGARWSLDVIPAETALAAVAPRIVTPDDWLSFEIIEHEASGWALVLLQHGQICGSHWLAYIDPATIPGRPS